MSDLYSDVKVERGSLQYLEVTFLKIISCAYCCKVNVVQKQNDVQKMFGRKMSMIPLSKRVSWQIGF